MNKFQLQLAARILEMADDESSINLCNDFSIPNTQEAMQFVIEYERWFCPSNPEDVSVSRDGTEIYIPYFAVAGYLAYLARTESETM